MKIFGYIDAVDELVQMYTDAGQQDKAEQLTSSVNDLAEALEDLQEKTTTAQQQLHEKAVKSQVS